MKIIAEPSTNKRSVSYRKRYARNKKIADAIKKCVGCERCNKQRPVSELQFHHSKGNKRTAVSTLYRISRKQMLEEIAKCDIVCRQCHQQRHKKQNRKA